MHIHQQSLLGGVLVCKAMHVSWSVAKEANLSLCSNSAISRCRSPVATLASSRSSALSMSRLSRSKVSWSTMERGGVEGQSGASPLCSSRRAYER